MPDMVLGHKRRSIVPKIIHQDAVNWFMESKLDPNGILVSDQLLVP